MTIVFSSVSDKLIAMTVDSAIAYDFDDGHREYTTGRKAYLFSGVGCVATWGARDGNHIGDYLKMQNISSVSHSIVDLADLVYIYLTQKYVPKEMGLDDVGYHVAGFDRNGCPRIYHVFWGFDRPRPPDQFERRYNKYDHSPNPGVVMFLYNGRNDLAQTVIHTLLGQINAGSVLRFNLNQYLDFARFGDFVARFAAELTPEVNQPFITCLLSPNNESMLIRNDSLCPIAQSKVLKALNTLGY